MSRILPILFNTEMVEAILDKHKTATRRLIKVRSLREAQSAKLKFFPGDILYVRETWAFWTCIECKNLNGESCKLNKSPVIHEDRDTTSEGCYIFRLGHPHPGRIIWRPSIHMPKAAARIWLRVKDVKIQRLQDMTLEDFIQEGVKIRPEAYNDPEYAYAHAKRIFKSIWDSTLHGSDKDKYGWDANPWVWVIEFERIEKP